MVSRPKLYICECQVLSDTTWCTFGTEELHPNLDGVTTLIHLVIMKTELKSLKI